MKVYISGPIAHYDLNERKAAFKCIENALLELGHEPVNPFNNGVPDDAHWRDHMKADIALLLQCDRIYLMPGWELSKGCKLELDVASSVGIPILNRYEPHPVQISCAPFVLSVQLSGTT